MQSGGHELLIAANTKHAACLLLYFYKYFIESTLVQMSKIEITLDTAALLMKCFFERKC